MIRKFAFHADIRKRILLTRSLIWVLFFFYFKCLKSEYFLSLLAFFILGVLFLFCYFNENLEILCFNSLKNSIFKDYIKKIIANSEFVWP